MRVQPVAFTVPLPAFVEVGSQIGLVFWLLEVIECEIDKTNDRPRYPETGSNRQDRSLQKGKTGTHGEDQTASGPPWRAWSR